MTDKVEDGGPAFPSAADTQEGHQMKEYGMSLRDWFAGHALVGLLAPEIVTAPAWDAFASDAYEIADAMLARRKINNS